MWPVILFIIGLALGSFLNVAALRYRDGAGLFSGKRLGGRSHCPHCGAALAWHELLPLISFFVQRGHCRHCGAAISWQYPFVEIVGGLIFLIPVFFYYFFEISRHATMGDLLVWYYWLAAAWVLAGLLMLLLAVIDWRTYTIPDETSAGIALLGLLIAALKWHYHDLIGWQVSFLKEYALMGDFGFGIFTGHLIAAFAGIIFFGGVYLVTGGRGIGFGDVKLAGALGLLLGWPDALLAFALAFIAGALVSLALLALGRKTMKESIPFGPFLIAGTFLTMLFGHALSKGYFNLFGVF